MDPLFITTFSTLLEDQSYELPSNMQHGDIELQNIAQAISKNQFNLVEYLKIIIAKLGVLYYWIILDNSGEESQQLKVLVLNVEHWEDEGLSHIIEAINDFANHVQGQYSDGIPEYGFLKYKDIFYGNRDGKDMAFTTGLTLYNS